MKDSALSICQCYMYFCRYLSIITVPMRKKKNNPCHRGFRTEKIFSKCILFNFLFVFNYLKWTYYNIYCIRMKLTILSVFHFTCFLFFLNIYLRLTNHCSTFSPFHIRTRTATAGKNKSLAFYYILWTI